MKIYTSYYSNFPEIPVDYLCIGISRYIPQEFQTTTIKNFLYTPNSILAPTKQTLLDHKAGKIDDNEYARQYFTSLGDGIKKLGFSSPNEYFSKMIAGFDAWNDEGFKAIVFLCYEKPGQFCHRHLLAALMKNLGFEIEELSYSAKKTITKSTEELF